jgi:hypothetical protein
MRGVWVLPVVGLVAALERWRLRKVGVVMSAAFMLRFVVGGAWQIWEGAGEPIA